MESQVQGGRPRSVQPAPPGRGQRQRSRHSDLEEQPLRTSPGFVFSSAIYDSLRALGTAPRLLLGSPSLWVLSIATQESLASGISPPEASLPAAAASPRLRASHSSSATPHRAKTWQSCLTSLRPTELLFPSMDPCQKNSEATTEKRLTGAGSTVNPCPHFKGENSFLPPSPEMAKTVPGDYSVLMLCMAVFMQHGKMSSYTHLH